MSAAVLRLWPRRPMARIRPEIYGHCVEHVGRCVYEGVWVGPGAKIPNRDGLRLDVIAALSQLRAPVLRWPGGCFASDYHWRDGVGPREKRPHTTNIWWGESESNAFGTHEFMQFCHAVGSAPYLCCNVATGTPREARDWLEYCNFGGDSRLTRTRARFGAPEPCEVPFWGIGSEPWGCGGRYRAEDYAREFARYAAALRALDPEARLVACGAGSGAGANAAPAQWNHDFCAAMPHADLIDHLALQRHFARGSAVGFSDTECRTLFADVFAMERDLESADALLRYFYPDKAVGIVVAAWGMWHPEASADNGLEQPHPLRDALLAGSVLNLFNRWSHRLAMANMAHAVNGLQASVATNGPRLLLTPTYYVFDMMRPHMNAHVITHELECPAYEARPAGLARDYSVPLLSVSASLGGKRILLTVTNHSPDEDVEVKILLRDAAFGNVTGRVLTADNPRAENAPENAKNVTAKRLSLEGNGAEFVHVFPRHSFTGLRFTLE